MTSNDKDWIDEILEDEECSGWQMGIIEGLLHTSSANYLYGNINLNELTNNEANEIIRVLRENDNPRDPKHQLEKMFRNGMFK
jgi:hypothetical protein